MRPEDLDRALGPTPQSFSDKMNQTLLHVEEEKQVKRIALRTVLIFALLVTLLCSTAYAVITQGLEWYYANRFTAYQQYEPEKHEAIMSHLQTDLPQSVTDPDVRITVQEAAWVPEEKVLVVSIAAVPADPVRCELHPMWNLDADGAYVGENGSIDPEGDGEDRAVHWLWTNAGFGPVDEMISPGKELLLLDVNSICLDGMEIIGDNSSLDAYVQEDGTVHFVLETRLDFLDPAHDAKLENYIELCKESHPESVPYAEQKLANAQFQRKLITEDSDGMIDLTIPYTVTLYTEDDTQLYAGGRQGEISFQIQIQ